MAIAQVLGFAPKQENLEDILTVFTQTEARLETFRNEQLVQAESEQAMIDRLIAVRNARMGEVERAERVQEKVRAITT